MRNPEEITYKGKKIIYLNFSDLKKKPNIIQLESDGGKIIQQQDINSALVLTNMKNMFFDYEIRNHFIEVAKANHPHVKASAVFGLYGLISLMYGNFIEKSGRNIKLFKSKKEALDYLVSFD